MIYLYDSNETKFSYNGKPLPTAYDVTVSNTLNSEYYVMGKYPLDKDKVYKEIVEDRIIKVHTMDGMQPFRIVTVSKHELYVEFEAWPLFYADMRNKLVKPLNLKGVSGQVALNSFKNNLMIDTPFDFYSDITDNHDYHTQDENERENNPKQLYNALDVFKTIVSRWGGELWIRGYDVRVNKRIGTDTEAMLYEKKNITEFVDTTNIEGIVTRLHGKSEWQDERQEGEEEGQKHSIEVTVDSPLINNYSGVVFEKQFTNNDIRTEQELINWLNLKFTTENIDKPQRTIEVGTNVIDGTKIGFADTLILKYIKHDTDVRIKVVGYECDGFENELNHVVLGQPKHTSSSTIGNTITDLVNGIVEPVDRKAVIAMGSANGKNTNFYGTEDPNTLDLDAQEGDLYFRTNGDEKQMYIFNGTTWDLILDTADTTKNTRIVEEMIQQAEADKEELENEIDKAYSDAVTEADRLAALRDTGITIEAGQITAGIIDAARIDAVEVLTNGLTANVIKSQHIQADNALIDKIFANEALITRLTSKEAFINSITVGDISADAITTGALNGANVRIINLDFDTAVGNRTSFVRTNWNDAVGGGVSISAATGVRTRATSGEESRLEDGGIKLYDRAGAFTGKFDSSYSLEGLGGVGIFVRADKHFSIIREGGTLANPSYTPIMYLRGNSNNMRMNTNLSMIGHNVVDVQTLRFTGGNAAVRGQASNNVEITTHGEDNRAVLFGQTTVQFERNIDMNGRNITNQSDIRLKSNVEDSQLDALREIERLRFIDYEWDKSKGAINENKPEERQFGLIAQYTPFLQTKAGESESYLSVDLTKQINLNSKATQELLHYTRLLEERIEVLESERTSA